MQALGEVRRVLVPGGRFVFVEHRLAPETGVARWQHRLTPLWRHIACSHHLGCEIDALTRAIGFRIGAIETGDTKRPKAMVFLYQGWAQA